MDETMFKAAMARLASGVTVVTTNIDGDDHGFTATSFTSLSLNPPLVLVCAMRNHRNHDYLERAQHYAVSLLSAADEALGLRFASSKVVDRFAGVTPQRAVTGAPILPSAIAWVDCRLRNVYDGGDHGIFVGEVLAAGTRDGAPLLYYDRQWGAFTPSA